jgi:hypothetical protein
MLDCSQLEIYSCSSALNRTIATWMPTFMSVTTREMLSDSAEDSSLMKEMPILMPNEAQMRKIVASQV